MLICYNKLSLKSAGAYVAPEKVSIKIDGHNAYWGISIPYKFVRNYGADGSHPSQQSNKQDY